MLNTQLTNLKLEFQVDRTNQHLCGWKHLTSEIEILQSVSGLPIELTDELAQTHHHNYSQQHQLAIDDKTEKRLQKNVITRCDYKEQEICLPIFLKKKPKCSMGLIFNLKNLNKNIEKQHFESETITSILNLVTPNMYFTKIDLKDTYYTILIQRNIRDT